jgi:hypothetical protein
MLTCLHPATRSTGHYICYVRVTDGEHARWVKIDDYACTTEENVTQKSASMLVYERDPRDKLALELRTMRGRLLHSQRPQVSVVKASGGWPRVGSPATLKFLRKNLNG